MYKQGSSQATMVEQVIASAGMKLVTAQKFRQALQELRGLPSEPQAALNGDKIHLKFG